MEKNNIKNLIFEISDFLSREEKIIQQLNTLDEYDDEELISNLMRKFEIVKTKDDEYKHISNVVEVDGGYISAEDAVELALGYYGGDEYVHRNDAIQTSDGATIKRRDSVTAPNGKIYHAEEY